jgi:nicotinamidase-related amidase
MKTALILVDVINDFFHPQGRNFKPEYEPTLKNIMLLLQTARLHGAVVVHAMESHHPAARQLDFEWKKLPPHCFAGDFDAEPVAGVNILPDREYVVHKRRFSAFFETDLNLLLREAGIERIIIVGVKTHVCVRATAQDGFGYGYWVVLPLEAVNSNYKHLHEASLEDIQRYMGEVVPLETALAMLHGEDFSQG